MHIFVPHLTRVKKGDPTSQSQEGDLLNTAFANPDLDLCPPLYAVNGKNTTAFQGIKP